MDNKNVYSFSASLRIMEAPMPHDEISSRIEPSHVHKRGDIRIKKLNKKWDNDIWSLRSPLPEKTELTEHLMWIWEQIKPHSQYIKSLVAKGVEVDLFCSYTCEFDNGGFIIQSEVYEILEVLKIPIGFSIVS